MHDDQINREISESIERPPTHVPKVTGRVAGMSMLDSSSESPEAAWRFDFTDSCWKCSAWHTDENASAHLRKWLTVKLCGENSFLTLEIFSADHFMFSNRDDEGAARLYTEGITEMLAVRDFAYALIELERKSQ